MEDSCKHYTRHHYSRIVSVCTTFFSKSYKVPQRCRYKTLSLAELCMYLFTCWCLCLTWSRHRASTLHFIVQCVRNVSAFAPYTLDTILYYTSLPENAITRTGSDQIRESLFLFLPSRRLLWLAQVPSRAILICGL